MKAIFELALKICIQYEYFSSQDKEYEKFKDYLVLLMQKFFSQLKSKLLPLGKIEIERKMYTI